MHNDIIKRVLHREGGAKITKDPNDPGGTTKYGVSQKAYPDLDIESLTEEEAIAIYKKDYWDKARVDELPKRLKEIYFDMCVNMGRRRAVKVLQKACNAKGADLIVDGGIGAFTIKACEKLEAERLTAYRVLYYANLVLKKDNLMRYYYGWFKRSIEIA